MPNLLISNFTYISENFMNWSMSGYTTALGVFVWPIIFSAIIGYVYLKNQSLTTAAAATLIIFSIFGNALVGVGIWQNLMFIFVSLIVTGLMVYWLSKRR